MTGAEDNVADEIKRDRGARVVRRRRRAATVPGVVVTAATLGTTGFAFTYAATTAPNDHPQTGRSSAVSAEITAERTAIARFRASIAATNQQIDALHQTGSSAGGDTAPAAASSGQASVSNTAATGRATPSSETGSAAGAPGQSTLTGAAPGGSGTPAASSTSTAGGGGSDLAHSGTRTDIDAGAGAGAGARSRTDPDNDSDAAAAPPCDGDHGRHDGSAVTRPRSITTCTARAMATEVTVHTVGRAPTTTRSRRDARHCGASPRWRPPAHDSTRRARSCG